MNTRMLMIASVAFLGIAGIATTFAPVELLTALNSPAVEPLPVIIQLLGALYLAFAIANWTAKDSAIGGIYGRPLSLGNYLHFLVGALALAKYEIAHGVSLPLLIALLIYTIFALCFGYLAFGRSAPPKPTAAN